MEVFLFLLAICPGILALPEQGAFEVTMTETQNIAVFTKSMYRNTSISTQISCNQPGDTEIRISWMLRWTPCAQEYAHIESSRGIAQSYLENPSLVFREMPYHFVKYIKSAWSEDSVWKDCHPHRYIEMKQNFGPPIVQHATMPISQEIIKNEMKKSAEDEKQVENKSGSRKKRDAEEGTKSAKPDPKTDHEPPKEVPADKKTKAPTNTVTTAYRSMTSYTDFHKITETWEDGIYLFVLKIESRSDSQGQYQPFNTTVRVNMLGPRSGYLSPIEWPLLPFYGVMFVVYVIFGLIWLSACNWRDLLRIQLWIGGVIFLGMVEKAVFLAEYESTNSTGISVRGAILFGELVSCMKRTLARMLVIVVSLGFGIVKPRLGPRLHKVLAMGGLYFILCAVQGCLRDIKSKTLAAIPLAVLDAAICWWIFTGLVNTIRTLRLRRNLVKLSLYRHFRNTLIFAVVTSVVFMVWSITQHKFSKCLSDWKNLWVDEAFWHVLFSGNLMVIMLLWRPSANNQRYAFSPLMEAADDEHDEAGEPMINDANGIPCCDGSDAPVEAPRPLIGIYDAIFRPSDRRDGPDIKTFRPAVTKAIDIYTKGGAYATMQEHRLGQLLPGYQADFIILESDKDVCDHPEEFCRATVAQTWVAGCRKM